MAEPTAQDVGMDGSLTLRAFRQEDLGFLDRLETDPAALGGRKRNPVIGGNFSFPYQSYFQSQQFYAIYEITREDAGCV